MTPIEGEAGLDEIEISHPTVKDGAAMHRLVVESGVLEPNSCYAYLLLATHFSGSCRVARRDGDLLGFVAAYPLPEQPETLFVWQVGVAPGARRCGLARRLLSALLIPGDFPETRFIEATVAPSNLASQRLFQSLAREAGVPCQRGEGFSPEDFGGVSHEAEELFRLGPFPSRKRDDEDL